MSNNYSTWNNFTTAFNYYLKSGGKITIKSVKLIIIFKIIKNMQMLLAELIFIFIQIEKHNYLFIKYFHYPWTIIDYHLLYIKYYIILIFKKNKQIKITEFSKLVIFILRRIYIYKKNEKNHIPFKMLQNSRFRTHLFIS